MVVLLSTLAFASINLASCSMVGSYEMGKGYPGSSDTKTHFALTEEVYLFWGLDEYSGSDPIIVTVHSPAGTTTYDSEAMGSLSLTASVAGTWTIDISSPIAPDDIIAWCSFTVDPLVVTPENGYGSLIAVAACFTAVVAFGASKRKGKKFTDSFRPQTLT